MKDIQPINNGEYLPDKPQSERRKEYKIRQSLIEQGHSKELANAVIGYTPEQVPFIYKTEPHKTISANSGRPMTSELWIGTTDEIHNLEAEWSDQIPEVIVQWWGHTRLDEESEVKEVERLEAHQLPDGSFVQLSYKGVTEMGEFDGALTGIEYYVPQGKFRPYGGKERMSYRIYIARHNKKNNYPQDIPGISLERPETDDTDIHEWSIDLSQTSFSGTTILNGFEQIVGFHLGEISVAKADYARAFRYTPLPESKHALITSGDQKTEYKLALAEQPDNRRAVIESLFPRAHGMMNDLAPIVRDYLATGAYLNETVSMAVDGILRNPEKIQILDRRLSEFTREDRFNLAQAVVVAIKQGKFAEWMRELQSGKSEIILNDVVNKNTYYLLNWFARTAPASADLSKWVEEAEKVITLRKNGIKTDSTMEFMKCFDGMCTSYVERFIEYVGQQIQGKSIL